MSDNNDADESDEREGYETDWLANSIYGYGFGYTKEQALTAMAGAGDPPGDGKDAVQVQLVEHVGSATVRMGGFRVEEFVDGEVVEIPVDAYTDLRDAAISASVKADDALAESEQIEDLSEQMG